MEYVHAIGLLEKSPMKEKMLKPSDSHTFATIFLYWPKETSQYVQTYTLEGLIKVTIETSSELILMQKTSPSGNVGSHTPTFQRTSLELIIYSCQHSHAWLPCQTILLWYGFKI